MSEISSSLPTGGDLRRRMDRIERLLETLNSDLRNIVRMEERLTQADIQHHESIQALRIETQECVRRLQQVELQMANSSIITRWGEKIFWAIILLALTLAAHHITRPLANSVKPGVENVQSGN